MQTGCFAGDTAGYPVTVDGSAGRSYGLTSDLIVPDENTMGILINTPSVTIDLGGFEIVRAACVGATVDCTPVSGGGSGVLVANSSTVGGVALRNGSITGMGSNGVILGPQAVSERRHWDLCLQWLHRLGQYIASKRKHNSGYGLNVGANSGYRENVLSGNTMGAVTGSGVDAGANVINGVVSPTP